MHDQAQTHEQTALEQDCEVFHDTLSIDDLDVATEAVQAAESGFEVRDADSANWVIRKIVDSRTYGSRVRAWADREVARAEREESSLMYLFGRQLQAWTRREIEGLGGRRKSVPLPAGTVGFRSTQSKIVIDDEGLALSWAKSNCPQSVVVVERLTKTSFNKFVETTGSVPESGVHVEPAAERFFVK